MLHYRTHQRLLFTLLLLGALLSPLIFAVAPVAQAQSTPPAGYRKLKDLEIFKTQKLGMWAGAGNGLAIETEQSDGNPTLIRDNNVTYNGLPSLRVNVTGACCDGWWSASMAGKDWELYNLTPYRANGALEFNIKGATGGETFYISLRDQVQERSPLNMQSVRLYSHTYVAVSTNWQTVRIPLSHFVPIGSSFDLAQMATIDISGGVPGQFWINNIRWTSPDNEPNYTTIIKINQLGYTPFAEKYALVSDYAENLFVGPGTPFQVLNTVSAQVAYEGTLTLVSNYDSASGERVLKADFSPLTTPGYYMLVISAQPPNPAPLASFQINNLAYRDLVFHATRYFYYQRQGIELTGTHAGTFTRGVGHPQDAAAPFRSGVNPPRNVMQGWYDAGDYGKYVNAGATAVSDLLWAYDLFPATASFQDGALNIPESGNGIPDLLDEVKWELDWILKMQDAASGGFYHMVRYERAWEIKAAPDQDTTVRYIEDRDGARVNIRPTATTGSAVAALAEASIVFRPFAASYADTLLNAARRGWNYLAATPGQVAPPPGPYPDADDADDRFWAAAALYRATGEAQYHNYVLANYQNFAATWDNVENAYGVGDMEMIGFLNYLKASNRDPVLLNWFTNKFQSWRSAMLNRSQNGVWRNTLEPWHYYWGSNMPVLNTTKVLVAGSKLLGNYDSAISQAAHASLNYILGVNPLGLGYVTNMSSSSIRRIHSAIYNYDGKPNMPAGYLSGGPNQYNNPLLYSRFPAKVFSDSNSVWTTNENAIYWNSALVFNAALADNEAGQYLPSPCVVKYTLTERQPGTFNGIMEITNAGAQVIGWKLEWGVDNGVVLTSATNAVIVQSGPWVELRNLPSNALFPRNSTISLSLQGNHQMWPFALSNIRLNGMNCTVVPWGGGGEEF